MTDPRGSRIAAGRLILASLSAITAVVLLLTPMPRECARADALPALARARRSDTFPIKALASGPNGTVWKAIDLGLVGGSSMQGERPDGSVAGGFALSGIAVRSIACWLDSTIVVLTEPDGSCTSQCYVRLFDGTPVRSFSIPNSPSGFGCPFRIAVAPNAILYVLTDQANVGVYDLNTGIRQSTFFAGDGSADANIPMAFGTDPNGMLLVALDKLIDTGTDVVDDYRLRRVLAGGSSPGEIQLPGPCTSLGADASGLVYVAFSGPPNLNQDFVRAYDASGTQQLSMVLRSPHSIQITGVAADPECGVTFAADTSTAGFTHRYTGDDDGDGICDSWELYGLQIGDGVANWKPPGCEIDHKDVYLEIDAMQNRAPDPEAVHDVELALQNAPSSHMVPPNPDGSPGISLHWEISDTTLTLQALCGPTFWTDFNTIKGLNYGTSAQRAMGTRMLNAKDRVYRYCLFGDDALHVCGQPGTAASGRAKDRGCRDVMVALGNMPYDKNVRYARGTRNQQASCLMHELGHAMGLLDGGNDPVETKPNYRSVMNYTWNVPTKKNEPFWHLTYSDRAFPPLNKSCVNEIAGMGGNPGDYTFVPHPNPTKGHRKIPETGEADFNNDGDKEGCENIPFLDRDYATPNGVFTSYEDWPLLKLSPAHNNVTGLDGILEMPITEVDRLLSDDPICDCNSNTIADWRDIALGISADANHDDIPDECQFPRVAVNQSLVVACARGDNQHLLLTGDVTKLCAYDTGTVHPPVFAVAHKTPGSDLRMWGQSGDEPDTLVSYTTIGGEQWLIGQSSWSGAGHVTFDMYAGPIYLGTTPDIEVRSLDLDPRVVGAVDLYDVAAVVAHYGPVTDPRYDLDDDGIVGPGDSTAVADHVTDGMHRPLLSPITTLTVAAGDTLPITWRAGQGDSAFITVLLERDETYGTYETLFANLPDNGAVAWRVAAADAPRSDYRIRIVRHFGVRQGEGINDYDWDESQQPFSITSSNAVPAEALPIRFAFRLAGPNPLRFATRFAIDLPIPAEMRLDILDLGGRLIRRIDARSPAGRHTLEWDLMDASSRRVHPGVYFIRFRAGDFSARTKLVVVQ